MCKVEQLVRGGAGRGSDWRECQQEACSILPDGAEGHGWGPGNVWLARVQFLLPLGVQGRGQNPASGSRDVRGECCGPGLWRSRADLRHSRRPTSASPGYCKVSVITASFTPSLLPRFSPGAISSVTLSGKNQ